MKSLKDCLRTGCGHCEGCDAGLTVSTFNKECYFYDTLAPPKQIVVV